MVVGKFKCESGGLPIIEFVGLRPKMYSYRIKDYNDPNDQGTEKIRVKGVARAAAKQLRHEMFLKQLNCPEENYLTNRRIGSEHHQIYTYEVCSHLKLKTGSVLIEDIIYYLDVMFPQYSYEYNNFFNIDKQEGFMWI